MIRVLILLALFTQAFFSQTQNEEYVKILGAENLTAYLDKASVKAKGDDIWVWVMQTHIPPLNIESIDKKIFKSKTYYNFNRKLNRYGILKIVYYDAKGNLIKEFDYEKKTDIPDYKYSYPVFENSLEEKILQTIYHHFPKLKPEEKKEE